MKQLTPKKWIIGVGIGVAIPLMCMAMLTILIDPYFHYHAPWGSYRLREPRYMNDGIARHFDYDALIAGTSMTGNFKCSEYDKLFDSQSVKVTLQGASFRETSMQLERALEKNPNIKEVLVSLDLDRIMQGWDWMKDYELPKYLYDDNILNDGPYLWNKSILLHDTLTNVILNLKGNSSTSMDDYSRVYGETGIEAVLLSCDFDLQQEENRHMWNEEVNCVELSMQKNFGELMDSYPDVTFRFFVPPYSIYYWKQAYLQGKALIQLEAEKVAIGELLKYENAEVFCLYDDTQLFLDADNYYDYIHYSLESASDILKSMAAGKHQITEENLEKHIEETKKFIMEYDYESLEGN